MGKLSKQSAARIASLINTLLVSSEIRKDAKEKKDFGTRRLFRQSEVRSVVELAEEFGIELPTYELMLPEHEQYERELKEGIERNVQQFIDPREA